MRLTFFCKLAFSYMYDKKKGTKNTIKVATSIYKYKNVQLQKYQLSNKSTMILSRDDCRLIQ